MAGYTADIINLVTRNLEDRYENGFPVIKELIQNADDAKAKLFKFGIADGITTAKHPLLKTRGLWIFNDGGFKQEDKRAIRSFAVNTKAGEDGTIGKFGLGMKSVFHLCEAFFYIAYDGEKEHTEVLNPWDYDDEDVQVHPEWNHFEEGDVTLLSSKIPEVARESQSWMFIWLPLRSKKHILKDGVETGSIIPKFPGDSFSPELDFLGDTELPSRISEVLPLLHNLQTVDYECNHFPSFTVSLNAPHIEDGIVAENKTGIVEIVHSTNTFSPLKFYGKRYLLENDEVTSLKAHPNWPKSRFRDKYGKQQEAPDKSKADGAVMLAMKQHDDEFGAEITIQWAVFLPLEKGELQYTKVIPEGPKRKFSIVLHNQFAIDAGRKGLFQYNSLAEPGSDITSQMSNEAVRKRWNQEIAQNGTLPLLPVVIAQLVQEHTLKTNEISALVEGIKSAKNGSSDSFAPKYLKYACRSFGFAKTISEEKAEWQLIDVQNAQLLTVPTSQNSAEPGRIFDVFPILRDTAFTLISNSDKSLLPADEYPISEDDYLKLLNSLDTAFLSDKKKVEYLTEFIRIHELEDYTASVRFAIVDLIRKSLLTLDLSEVTANKKAVGELFNVIGNDSFVTLGTKEQKTSPSVWKKLWSVDSAVLPLPNYFESFTGNGQPHKDDIVAWIKAVGSAERAIVKDIRDGCIKNKEVFLSTNSDLPLIEVGNRNGRLILLSLHEIKRIFENRNLFPIPTVQSQEDFKLFTAILPNEELYTISQKEFELAYPGKKISAISTAPYFYSLAYPGKELGDLKDRVAFLDASSQVFSQLNNDSVNTRDEIVKGLRYLIHGNPAKNNDVNTPLWAGSQSNSVWGKLRQMLFGEADSWAILNREISGTISENKYSIVGIRRVEQQAIESELLVDFIRTFKVSEFTIEEQKELLKSINDQDKWRALPFHKTESGRLTSIGDSLFLNRDKIKYPDDCNLTDTVIALSDNPLIKDKQENYIKSVLTIEDVIRALLHSDKPSEHYEFIMKSLEKNPQLTELTELKEKEWLKLKNDKITSPDSILDFPRISDKLKELCSQCDDIFTTSDSLIEGAELLKPLFSSEPEEYLPKISLMLNEIPEFTIGKLSSITKSEIKNSLHTLSKYDELPGWGILASIVDKDRLDESVTTLHNYFFPTLENELDKEKIVSTLNWILNECNVQIEVYNLYLKELFRNGNIAELLPEIKLRNENGRWKNPAELCLPQEGYSRSYSLCKSQVPIVKSQITREVNERKSVVSGIITEKDLHLFTDDVSPIERWIETVSPGVVGAFLMFLGKSYQELADKYLREDGRSLENALKTLDWNNSKLQKESAFSEKVDIRIRWIGSNENCSTVSLIGEPLTVPLQKNPQRLIVGTGSLGAERASYYDPETRTYNYILLDSLTDNSPEEQIKRTISYIYQDCFEQQSSGFEALWNEITEKKQLSVVVVRKTILEDIPAHLRQIGAASEDVFKEYISHIKRIRSKISEADESNRDIDTADYKKQLSSVREKLGDLISSDEDCQAIILDKVKKKIAEHQYQKDGVPFEIFQNADDANVELEECEPVTQAPFFSVSTDSQSLYFEYSGRPVNYTGNNGREDFKYDLEKMLIIQASDKSVNNKVTGKFGLGFKSVFLISDSPRVRSGELDFSIAGGLLPVPTKNAVRTPRKTIIELPLNEDIASEETITRFEKLIPYSVVFSHRIKQVRVNNNNYQWSPAEIHPSVEIGTSPIALDDSHFILFNTTNAKILFSLKGSGFNIQSREVPSVWVTAPLRDSTSFGFCVNSSFQIDTGRGQLGDMTENIKLSTSIGVELGTILVDFLQTAQESWDEYRGELFLFNGISFDEFYTSVWITLLGRWKNKDKSTQVFQIGRTLALEAFKEMLKKLELIPNGFSGTPCKLLAFTKEEIYWEIPEKYSDNKNEKEKLLNVFQEYSGVNIVSNDIAYLLRQIYPNFNVKELTVKELINLKRGKVYSPEEAQKTEAVLQLVDEHLYDQSVFDGIKFNTERGGNETPTRLLSLNNKNNEEELMRASFAPEIALLAKEYSGEALQFFIRVRGNLQATTEQLEKWMLNADSDEKKINSLRYILDGELSSLLSKKVRGQGWVRKLDDSLLSSFFPEERSELIRQLAEHVAEQPYDIPTPTITAEKLSLIKIHQWWETEGRDQYLPKYLGELYPSGDCPDLYDKDEYPINENWMQLFTFASFKSLGRVKDYQTKGFLQHLKNHGWWETICLNKPTECPEKWFNILKEYCTGSEYDEIYSYWMDSFHRIFKIREFLDVYIQLFEYDGDCSNIDDYLTPNASTALQGSGLVAPSLKRTLKIGHSFIIRELLRNGHLTHKSLHKFAFMNSWGIRALLEAAVGGSYESCQDIYRALEKVLGEEDVTFGGDFDIPLIIVSRESELQGRFFDDNITDQYWGEDE
ncbi:sacsin N-terminal ATP-binding-like domain-containing protein [Chitinivibrio alkaliphilus]|uniref:Sacsin/Nov domain-containing protein n=1 Tax=Chitinivibrio alkaliphilus ACht1 TaxID=1313304 RepID=U7D2H3_9BACT|nr:hypothetical protein [Chitinivibrio alkaliphilus]ERP30704.1 hypothetical protein CALK_2475 [Chitinivibrio alkaliphilus ACht1]